MKKVLGILVVTVFTTSSAFGGLVSLSPSNWNVDPSDASTFVDFTVAIDSVDGGAFNTFGMVMGSNDGLLMNDFTLTIDEFNGFWNDNFSLWGINCSGPGCQFTGGPIDPPFYPAGAPISEANIEFQGFTPSEEGNPFAPLPHEAPFLLAGILTVEVPGGLNPGVYDILVNGDSDVGRSNVGLFPSGEFELLFGSIRGRGDLGIAGTVTVVPEPATLALLGVGGLVALRRRRRKA